MVKKYHQDQKRGDMHSNWLSGVQIVVNTGGQITNL